MNYPKEQNWCTLVFSLKAYLGNILECSLMLLETSYLQLFTYFSIPLLPQLSSLTYQNFHQILFFPVTHPRMGSLDLFFLYRPS